MITKTRPRRGAQPFADRFTGLIPSALRAAANKLSWQRFLDSYSPETGAIALGDWSVSIGAHGAKHFDATIDIDNRTRTVHVDTLGPIAALSGALHDAGVSIEILEFHQQHTTDGTATFVNCEHEGRRHWAMAISDNDTDSALRAVVAAANILRG